MARSRGLAPGWAIALGVGFVDSDEFVRHRGLRSRRSSGNFRRIDVPNQIQNLKGRVSSQIMHDPYQSRWPNHNVPPEEMAGSDGTVRRARQAQDHRRAQFLRARSSESAEGDDRAEIVSNSVRYSLGNQTVVFGFLEFHLSLRKQPLVLVSPALKRDSQVGRL
jgi:hypothetical protein